MKPSELTPLTALVSTMTIAHNRAYAGGCIGFVFFWRSHRAVVRSVVGVWLRVLCPASRTLALLPVLVCIGCLNGLLCPYGAVASF